MEDYSQPEISMPNVRQGTNLMDLCGPPELSSQRLIVPVSLSVPSKVRQHGLFWLPLHAKGPHTI